MLCVVCDFLTRCSSCTKQQMRIFPTTCFVRDTPKYTVNTTRSEIIPNRSYLVWKKGRMGGGGQAFGFSAQDIRFKYNVQMSDRIPSNWSGHHRINATCSDNYFFYGNRFFCHVSWWVTSWVVQLVSVASLCFQDSLDYTYSLVENGGFWSCHADSEGKSCCQKRLYFVALLDISARSRPIVKPFGPT